MVGVTTATADVEMADKAAVDPLTKEEAEVLEKEGSQEEEDGEFSRRGTRFGALERTATRPRPGRGATFVTLSRCPLAARRGISLSLAAFLTPTPSLPPLLKANYASFAVTIA